MAIQYNAPPAMSPRMAAPEPRTEGMTNLRWVATIAPAVAVFVYETFRHQVFEHNGVLEGPYGNVLAGLVALTLSFLFASFIFTVVDHIQRDAIERTRRAAALSSMIEERERLSRELHDGLAQVISYVLVRLDTIRNLVESAKDQAAIAELESLRLAVDEVNSDVRESIAGLRSRVVERGLQDALADYLEEFEERYGIAAELRAKELRSEIAPEVALQLFRIAQEALTNVRKHAAATEVRVGLDEDPSRVLLVIADNGRGFEDGQPQPNLRSFGLAGMRERAQSVGGTCDVARGHQIGTTVTISVPVGTQP